MKPSKKEATSRPQNPLLEACVNVFALTAPLVGASRGVNLDSDFRAKVQAALDELVRLGFELQIDPNVVNEAKYAVVAFIDEKVLSSAWAGRSTWMGRPLQLEYFGEHLAGENFFHRLARLRQGGERSVDVLEVYYTCLQLGFEGMYRMRGLEQLMALQVDLRSQLNDYRARVPRTLSLHGVANVSLMERVRREVPYWVIGVTTISVLVFGYIAFAFLLDERAATARAALDADRQHIATIAAPGLLSPGGAPGAGTPRTASNPSSDGTRRTPDAARPPAGRPTTQEADI